ncbi:Glucooligosaccharide oxidase [Dothidotthia symphoricarpi CBS 119687]|uniref:Glucooligosaccharide oxidase n=1 Tax=Dothidotthia symphoricarpi CBS 119687 TaxID=1392245 RepID=A0A6A6ANZ3_9PLEO|nr:Glucooligosaccharide oxidase [Dothidotthia symphoricarpi CBS 119687]KAF2133639.1 Glucooligosaccharide oxidase [Dothidotthia symphoricarpi CBS 119687]
MPSLHSYKQQILAVLLCLAPSLVLGQTAAANVVHSCLTEAGVQSTISTDNTWTNDTAAFQFRLPRQPVAVAFPENKDEVALALGCARKSTVKVSVVGRGHSFQGSSYGNPGNLVINMAAFTDMSFDAATNELKFGGGVNVGPAAKFLWDGHKRHFPHVRGSHVGLVGSSMGGGFGTTSRVFGTPVDNLVSVEYMLANGTIVTAGLGSDLLWAAKGAGASFGVVLSATTKTFSVPLDGAVSYSLALGDVDVNTAAASLLAIQKWSTGGQAPDALSLRFALANYASAGFFYGEEAAFDKAFAPLITSLRTITPTVNLTKTVLPTFWDSEVAGTGPGMNLATGGALGGRASLVQSWTTTSDHPLTLAQAKALFTSYRSLDRTDLNGTGFLDLWGGVNRNVKDSDTSYAHGKNLWLVRVDGVAAGTAWPSNGVAYMQNLMKPFGDALKKSASLRSFANYVDSELSVADWSARLYGANFAKLQKIKKAVDPTGLFSGFKLAIPLPSRRNR